MKAEIVVQVVDQREVLLRRLIEDKTGVIDVGRDIFPAPQASGNKVDQVHLAITAGQLEAQLKVGLDQQRQVADQHQTALGGIAQIPHGLVREAIEDLQERCQFVTLDATLSNHIGFTCKGPG